MNSATYLQRVGYAGPAHPTEDTLDRLIGLHQQAVPFENIDIVRLHRPIVLDRARLYGKIVGERRGGFCYELNGLFDQLLDQREPPRVPVLEMIDARLAEAQTDGWRYADLPEDGEAFRRSFAALDDDARGAFGRPFAELECVPLGDEEVQSGVASAAALSG